MDHQQGHPVAVQERPPERRKRPWELVPLEDADTLHMSSEPHIVVEAAAPVGGGTGHVRNVLAELRVLLAAVA